MNPDWQGRHAPAQVSRPDCIAITMERNAAVARMISKKQM
jgi:hypothetical protein